jgi:hypothetical protein
VKSKQKSGKTIFVWIADPKDSKLVKSKQKRRNPNNRKTDFCLDFANLLFGFCGSRIFERIWENST